MSDRYTSDIYSSDPCAPSFHTWATAGFDSSERLSDLYQIRRYPDEYVSGEYSSPSNDDCAIDIPSYLARPQTPSTTSKRQVGPPPMRGDYYGQAEIPQSLPISEYSDSARGWVNRNITDAKRRLEERDLTAIKVREICDVEIYLVWDPKKERLSVEALPSSLIDEWATEGASKSEQRFLSGVRNVQCAPTRAFMWDTLRIALLQAKFSTETSEEIATRDGLFRLRLATPETKARAESKGHILDFECFRYAIASGLAVDEILTNLTQAGVLSPEGRVLRVVSPAELHERILIPAHRVAPESEVTRELAHAFCLTILCLFELRTHETIDAVLRRHSLHWINLGECFAYHRASKALVDDIIEESPNKGREIMAFEKLWDFLRGREQQLRRVLDATDKYQVLRIFPDTIERPELLNVLGENYRYPSSGEFK